MASLFFFFQKFWHIVKIDLVEMFADWFKGDLDIYRLNFAMITLIPKVENASNMKFFRPISLINCSFKIFSKVLTLRLGKISEHLISKNQSVFIKWRYILESVVVAHELVHSVNKSKQPGVILKLDYEKAYDRVNWDFLFEILRTRNFSPTWIRWIEQLVIGGSIGVNLNGEESSFFKPSKGLRQGEPNSPLLFNLVGDVLTRLLNKAVSENLIGGLFTDLEVGGVVSLQYADDTIIFF